MAYGFKRDDTVALKKESVRMNSPESIANGVRVQREVTVGLQKRVA
jgi:hypothetical protein